MLTHFRRGRDGRSTERAKRLCFFIGILTVPVLAAAAGSGSRAEARAEAVIRRDLDAAGLDWAQVRVRGRRGVLAGLVPESGLGSRALGVARSSRCATFFLDLPCVRSIEADFGTVIPENELWPKLTAHVDGGVLTLSGTVPDQVSRSALRSAARAALSSPRVDRVVDDLAVSGALNPAGTRPLIRRVTAALSLCRAGRASVEAGLTRFHCEAGPALADSIRYLLATPLPTGELDSFELTVSEPLPRHTAEDSL